MNLDNDKMNEYQLKLLINMIWYGSYHDKMDQCYIDPYNYDIDKNK